LKNEKTNVSPVESTGAATDRRRSFGRCCGWTARARRGTVIGKERSSER
jgi:hypothetical protein